MLRNCEKRVRRKAQIFTSACAYTLAECDKASLLSNAIDFRTDAVHTKAHDGWQFHSFGTTFAAENVCVVKRQMRLCKVDTTHIPHNI